MKTFKGKMANLTLLWRKSLSYRNHSIDRDIYGIYYMVGISVMKELKNKI